MTTRRDAQTLYQQQVRSGILSSKLPSPDMPTPNIIRAPRGTNPVNASNDGITKRTMTPLAPQANPRVQNPAINVTPWSTSYAKSRSQPKSATMKSSYRARKRAASKKQSMRQRRTGGGA